MNEPIGVRCWTDERRAPPKANPVPTDSDRRRRAGPRRHGVTEALVFDVETRATFGQPAMVVVWRLLVDGTTVEEGIAVPDDASDAERAVVARYVAGHAADAIAHRIVTMSLSRWLDERLFLYGYRRQAAVVGFNLPFDLGALGGEWTEARGGVYRGGFSIKLWPFATPSGAAAENWRRPRLLIRNLGNGALIAWAATADDHHHGRRAFPGHFVDVAGLAYALSGVRGHTLETACETFGIDFAKDAGVAYGVLDDRLLDYARADVAATTKAYLAAAAEVATHPGAGGAGRLYSPAGIVRGYLGAMAMVPPAERFDLDPDVLGASMCALYGGRSEARVLGAEVPVVCADVRSTYPALARLIGLWRYWTAERIEVVDVTDDVTSHLGEGDLAQRWTDPETWHRWGATLVEVIAEGDVLPHRIRHQDRWATTVRPLHHRHRLWWTLADVVAAVVLGGRVPKVTGAIRLDPIGTAAGLRPIDLPGGTRFDPATDDLFDTMYAQRYAQPDRATAWKMAANAAAHGLASQVDKAAALARPKPVTLNIGAGAVEGMATAAERPGWWSFPPVAAAVCGGARLLLALVEAKVADAGGVIVHMDTDSVKIVATPTGGLVSCPGGTEAGPDGAAAVKALPVAQVEAILDDFRPLCPWDDRSLWKIEHESAAKPLTAFATADKSYSLWRDGAFVDGTASGLGGIYADPDRQRHPCGERAWVVPAWEWARAKATGSPAGWAPPEWFDLPAPLTWTFTTPAQARSIAAALGARPFGFYLRSRKGFGAAAAPGPVRPYSADPAEWLGERAGRRPWVDAHSGHAQRTDGGHEGGPRLLTYFDVIFKWAAPTIGAGWTAVEGTRLWTPGLCRRGETYTGGLVEVVGKEVSLDDDPYGLDDTVQVLARFCACGCGQPLGPRHRRFVDDAHRKRANRKASAQPEGSARSCACGCGQPLGPGHRRFVDDAHRKRANRKASAQPEGSARSCACGCGQPLGPGLRKWADDAHRKRAARSADAAQQPEASARSCAWPGCTNGADGDGPGPARARSPYCSEAHRRRARRAGPDGPAPVPATFDVPTCAQPGCEVQVQGCQWCRAHNPAPRRRLSPEEQLAALFPASKVGGLGAHHHPPPPAAVPTGPPRQEKP